MTAIDSTVWGAQTRSSSRGRAVLVNQSAASILPADAIEPARSNDAEAAVRGRFAGGGGNARATGLGDFDRTSRRCFS
jgi:hypothetical protein